MEGRSRVLFLFRTPSSKLTLPLDPPPMTIRTLKSFPLFPPTAETLPRDALLQALQVLPSTDARRDGGAQTDAQQADGSAKIVQNGPPDRFSRFRKIRHFVDPLAPPTPLMAPIVFKTRRVRRFETSAATPKSRNNEKKSHVVFFSFCDPPGDSENGRNPRALRVSKTRRRNDAGKGANGSTKSLIPRRRGKCASGRFGTISGTLQACRPNNAPPPPRPFPARSS